MCFSTMLREMPMRSAICAWLRPSKRCSIRASRRRGEFGEHPLQALQALQALGRGQWLVVFVGQRLGFYCMRFVVHLVPDLLPAPVIAQQVARHLEQKGAGLFDLGPVAVVEPLGEDVLGHVRRIAGVVRAFTQVMQDVCIEPADGVRRGGVGLEARHENPSQVLPGRKVANDIENYYYLSA